MFRILEIDQWLTKTGGEFIQEKWLNLSKKSELCDLTCLSFWKSVALQSQWTPAASSHWGSQIGLKQYKMSHSWKTVTMWPIWQLLWKTPLTGLVFFCLTEILLSEEIHFPKALQRLPVVVIPLGPNKSIVKTLKTKICGEKCPCGVWKPPAYF